jgi:MFS family permease
MVRLSYSELLRMNVQNASSNNWRIVVLLMLVVACGHFNRIGMAVAGTERIIGRTGIDETQMGKVYSGFLLAYTVAMIPAGWLIDRFGARAALMVFTFGSAIFVGLTGVVGALSTRTGTLFAGLLLVRSLMGAINAPLHPAAARTVFTQVRSNVRSLSNGLVTFAACAGISATYYGFGLLIDRFDWPLAFMITGGLTLAVAMIWTWGTRELRNDTIPGRTLAPERTMASWSEMGRVARHRGIFCVTLSYAALGYFQYLFFYWIQYYVGTVEGLGTDVSRRYSTFTNLTMGVGMVVGGWLADQFHRSDRFARRRGLVPAVGMAASGLIFECGLLASNPQLLLAAFVASAFLLGACEGAFWTTVVEIGQPRGGLAAGIMNLGGNAGGLLSPIATPWMGGYFGAQLGEAAGWRISLAIAGAIPLLGAVCWFGVDATAPRENDFSTEEPALPSS